MILHSTRRKETEYEKSLKQAIASIPEHPIYSFVTRYGELHVPQQLPRSYRSGAFRACFANSYKMAMRHSVNYVEGYAFCTKETLSPILHAWCIDEDGMVLDRTWKKGVAYFGVPIRRDFLQTLMWERKERVEKKGEEMYYGLLDDWQHGWPVIRTFSEQPELWLQASGASRSRPQ